jgi:hypothetical protein
MRKTYRNHMPLVPHGISIVDHHSEREKEIQSEFENFKIWTCHAINTGCRVGVEALFSSLGPHLRYGLTWWPSGHLFGPIYYKKPRAS